VSGSPPRYDAIGRSYVGTRAEDPRIAAAILDALGDATSVVNVGAGTGNYEPRDGRDVVAVEPSPVMRGQRPPGSAPVVDARAEALPFADGAFDAAMAVFSDHHWADRAAGLRELRRVARRVVVLNWNPASRRSFWLTRDFLPGLGFTGDDSWEAGSEAALGAREERVVPIPADCRDGFLLAYWKRPEALLDPVVRANISVFALMDDAEEAALVAQLAADLESGAWAERNADILGLDELDVGCRILVAW
jgi:SAM-dependent methyltransferase